MNNILPQNLNWEDWLSDNLSEAERQQWQALLLSDASIRLESEQLLQLDKTLQQVALREKVRQNGKVVMEEISNPSGNQRVRYIILALMIVMIAGLFLFVTTKVMNDFYPLIQPSVPKIAIPALPQVPEKEATPAKALDPKPSIAQLKTPPSKNEPASGIRGNNKTSSVVDSVSMQNDYVRPNLSNLKATAWNSVIIALEKNQLEKAITQLSKNPANNDTTHYLMAICQLESNQADNAARHLMRIYTSNNPFYSDVQWLLACCFKKTGKLSNARQILQNIMATPKHPWAKQAQSSLDAWRE